MHYSLLRIPYDDDDDHLYVSAYWLKFIWFCPNAALEYNQSISQGNDEWFGNMIPPEEWMHCKSISALPSALPQRILIFMES